MTRGHWSAVRRRWSLIGVARTSARMSGNASLPVRFFGPWTLAGNSFDEVDRSFAKTEPMTKYRTSVV